MGGGGEEEGGRKNKMWVSKANKTTRGLQQSARSLVKLELSGKASSLNDLQQRELELE